MFKKKEANYTQNKQEGAKKKQQKDFFLRFKGKIGFHRVYCKGMFVSYASDGKNKLIGEILSN